MLSLRVTVAVAAAISLGACARVSTTASTGAQNAVPSVAASSVATTVDAATAPFVASRKSKKFYPADCHTVKLIKVADRVGFASIKDAQDAGFAKDGFSADCRY